MPGAALVPAALAEMPTGCAPLSPAAPVAIAAPAPSKASQILGGTSALDAIRAQQAAPASHPLLAGGTNRKFEPAAAPAPRVQPACSIAQKPFSLEPQFTQRSPRFATPRPTLAFVAPRPSGSRDIVLGSRMVPIGRTSFDAQWQRVSGARTDLAPTLATMGVSGTSRRDLIASVNSWVNRRIGHAEDTELFGRSDYWADAATTLRLGRGDCEDFALLKMELLAAAGVKREDMMLTLARDLIRRRDHAVLLVKTDEGFVMLDNVGSTPLDASRSHGYRPVMSLGAKQNFLHGY
ncbi:transglutaminase-like cysteine peptidase [Qipengyuania sp. 1NDW9]|uniref:transglutaminase-like cysteine peptidase n=1 Tax=Qipengyuania xiapuensis TaxID=2867236 RepID=UPI001C8671EA|nr:transglutaminase-like cysteine peptidase [Qipengyuania xiapuensis]MBX7494086.1 transglutaminase-like cysteine peptidase [Qipengyuania xiapuensis]